MSYKNVTHVIFDLDGLILASESIYNIIINDIARRFGKTCDKDLRMKILGTLESDTAKIAVRELQLPISPEEFETEMFNRVNVEMKNLDLLPGAERLIVHLHKHNIPIAIATSSSMKAVEVKTRKYSDLFAKFHHVVSGSSDHEVKNGKPAPDIYLVCASRFPSKPSPEECLVFEDAPNGVKGARLAGMQAVLVPSEETSDELKKDATIVLNSLNDFKPELFGLPPFNK